MQQKIQSFVQDSAEAKDDFKIISSKVSNKNHFDLKESVLKLNTDKI